MSKNNKNFTVIDWDELKIIKFYVVIPKKPRLRLKYSDLLIISYIKGFGEDGYYGSQASLGKLIGMSQEQVSRILKDLLTAEQYFTKVPLFIKKDKAICFNKEVLYHQDGTKLVVTDSLF